MKLITPWSLFLGLILSAPSIWQAWSDPTVDVTSALVRFVLAVLFASMSLRFLDSIVKSYKQGLGRPHRRTSDRLPTDSDSGKRNLR